MSLLSILPWRVQLDEHQIRWRIGLSILTVSNSDESPLLPIIHKLPDRVHAANIFYSQLKHVFRNNYSLLAILLSFLKRQIILIRFNSGLGFSVSNLLDNIVKQPKVGSRWKAMH